MLRRREFAWAPPGFEQAGGRAYPTIAETVARAENLLFPFAEYDRLIRLGVDAQVPTSIEKYNVQTNLEYRDAPHLNRADARSLLRTREFAYLKTHHA